MIIQNPKLTFGIEIELTNFWNGKPLITTVETYIVNELKYSLSEDALLTLRMTPKDDGWDAKLIEATLTESNRQIDLDANGNILPPWKEDLDCRDVYYSRHWHKGSAIHQAKILLDENDLHNWQTVGDPSLTNTGLNAIEIVSPVLEMGDFSEIQKVCKIFTGIAEPDWTCGLHVHIGRHDKGFEYEQVNRLIKRWLRTEPYVQTHPFYQPMGDRNNPIRDVLNLKKVSRATNLDQLREAMNSGSDRHFLINLWALNAHNTIEFRGFRSTLNIEIIKSIVKFCEQRVIDSF